MQKGIKRRRHTLCSYTTIKGGGIDCGSVEWTLGVWSEPWEYGVNRESVE